MLSRIRAGFKLQYNTNYIIGFECRVLLLLVRRPSTPGCSISRFFQASRLSVHPMSWTPPKMPLTLAPMPSSLLLMRVSSFTARVRASADAPQPSCCHGRGWQPCPICCASPCHRAAHRHHAQPLGGSYLMMSSEIPELNPLAGR